MFAMQAEFDDGHEQLRIHFTSDHIGHKSLQRFDLNTHIHTHIHTHTHTHDTEANTKKKNTHIQHTTTQCKGSRETQVMSERADDNEDKSPRERGRGGSVCPCRVALCVCALCVLFFFV